MRSVMLAAGVELGLGRRGVGVAGGQQREGAAAQGALAGGCRVGAVGPGHGVFGVEPVGAVAERRGDGAFEGAAGAVDGERVGDAARGGDVGDDRPRRRAGRGRAP